MARAWFDDLPTGDISEMLRPEDDTQELWELNGRVESLRGLMKWKRKKHYSISLDEIDAVMGWDDEEVCRKCGHPASED